MLAVIHHLLLMEQIPLPAILALCSRLTRRHLVVEWVPVEDPMFQSLDARPRCALRRSSEADLLARHALQAAFNILDRHALWRTHGSGRVLLEKACLLEEGRLDAEETRCNSANASASPR